MKRTLIITTLLSFLIVVAGAFTFAQQQRENRGGNMHEIFIEKLNLTDQQQIQIEEIRFAHQNKIIDLRADTEKKELGLKELQSTTNFSRGDYMAKIEEIISAENKVKLERANHHMDVYELLDAEQQETWSKMKPMKHGKHNKMKKHHRNMNQF
jgi:Spy/CpxP family protein refolding chaperone